MSAGLCDFCLFQKINEVSPGVTVSACDQSEIDHRFPKYPRLPVYHCVGYEARRAEVTAEEVRSDRP
ncbi:MAG TPA: hypothetical protein VE549_11170 [Myxococcaceae bacterium]|nr:hypothetical protein [Myxococcaceae bacterium]